MSGAILVRVRLKLLDQRIIWGLGKCRVFIGLESS